MVKAEKGRGQKLTPKQSAFVDEYLVDLNATQAAIRAGYKENSAYAIGVENLRKPQIAGEIQRRMDERSERVKIDADFVLQGIARNISRCEQGSPVTNKRGEAVMTEGPNGEQAPMWRYDPANALKGYELLGKHLKLFSDRIDHSSTDGTMTPSRITRVVVDEGDKQ